MRFRSLFAALAAAGCAGAVACGGGDAPVTPATPSPTPSPAAAARATRIMPLGDSITQGNTQTNSYRRPLWRLLEAAGAKVDFVGSETSNNGGPPPNPDFDLDHEGHWGWRADQVLAMIDAWARAQQPDVVLVHLGSNDVFQGQDNASTLDELSSIVARLRAANPSVKVLLAQLIPTRNAAADARIVQLNAAISGLAARLHTSASPVVAVDHYSGFDADRDTRDGIHPNAAGETKMANVWLAAYQALAVR
jgi:lysophospholipase L1-like esterase